MGYDFHLDDDGPKLIEVNTNAGGAFLNAFLAKAQKACCAEVEQGLISAREDRFETGVVAMFRNEWRRQFDTESPRRIAIIDDRPEEQYLYPEFVLATQLLVKHGIDAVIGMRADCNIVVAGYGSEDRRLTSHTIAWSTSRSISQSMRLSNRPIKTARWWSRPIRTTMHFSRASVT